MCKLKTMILHDVYIDLIKVDVDLLIELSIDISVFITAQLYYMCIELDQKKKRKYCLWDLLYLFRLNFQKNYNQSTFEYIMYVSINDGFEYLSLKVNTYYKDDNKLVVITLLRKMK